MPRLRVEVVHALAGAQAVVELMLSEGATAGQAIEASGLAAASTRTELRIGIGGQEVLPDRRLQNGDRVEILRPLAAEPREARRQRARKARRR